MLKKAKNHLAIIDNYNFCDRKTDTDGHCNSMTDPVQRAESVNIII